MSAIDLYNTPSPGFEAKVVRSLHLLREVAATYPRLTQASSLGAEDMVVTHLIHLTGISSGIFVLDTGKLHAETLAVIRHIEKRYGHSVEIYRPKTETVLRFVRQHGEKAMYESMALRKNCCDIRKMEPLERALKDMDGWITGLRREQSSARADVAEIVQEHTALTPGDARPNEPVPPPLGRPGGRPARVKISPLVEWTWGDVWHFIAINQLEYNTLHDQFYPSIGCEPCTRAISVGEDFRAGRWWWEQESAKECGLHVSAASAMPTPASSALPR